MLHITTPVAGMHVTAVKNSETSSGIQVGELQAMGVFIESAELSWQRDEDQSYHEPFPSGRLVNLVASRETWPFRGVSGFVPVSLMGDPQTAKSGDRSSPTS